MKLRAGRSGSCFTAARSQRTVSEDTNSMSRVHTMRTATTF